MMLDPTSRNDLFVFMRELGYTGTKELWLEQLRRETYKSELRCFDSVWLAGPLEREFPQAAAFLRRVLKIATPHFNQARVWDSSRGGSISLNRSEARRRARTPRPLRLDGMSLDLERRDGRLEVRCLLYVNNEFRRDRYFIFHACQPKRGDA